MAEPEWLRIAREVQAIAQTGLAFTGDPYDRERYERLREIAASMMQTGLMQGGTFLPVERFEEAFAAEAGYATPKLDLRGAVFDEAGRILMVREAIDEDRWTLPGGWADVNQTPAEGVVREIREESGYEARAVKLALVHDRARQGHAPAGPYSVIKLFFVCERLGGAARGSLETSEARFFAQDELPRDLSTSRVLPHQLERLFRHRREPGLPTEFD